MYRIDNSTASPSLPTPSAVGPNPDAFFSRGDPSTATLATIVDDDWLNMVQEELCNVAAESGSALSKTTYNQILLAIQYLIQKNAPKYAASSSAANTYVATLSPAPVAYTIGMIVFIQFTNANTSASSLNLNTLGAKTIKRLDGTDLLAGDIQAGMIGALSYDGTNFQLINSQRQVPLWYGASTTAANTYTVTVNDPPSAYAAGQMFLVKFSHHNTGACTLNVNSLGAKSIVRNSGDALAANSILDGQLAILTYDGTNLQLSNPSLPSVNVVTITSSGTYVPTPGMIKCYAELVAGAGGTAGLSQGSGVNTGTVGGGSGAGGYSAGLFTAADIGASQSVTIGAGGLAGASGNHIGGDGGDSAFGSLLACGGGKGGNFSTTVAAAACPTVAIPGVGGTATVGSVLLPGQAGTAGTLLTLTNAGSLSVPGTGGTPAGGFGVGGAHGELTAIGYPGTGYGSGASGGIAHNCAGGGAQTGDLTGVAGQPGALRITEYFS